MSSQYQYLRNLYVLRGVGGKDGYVSNIVACQGFDAFIDGGGTVVVSVETDVAEVGLYKSWLQIRHANGGISDIYTQTIGKCFHSGFCGTIDVAAGIGSIASYRANVDNMSTIALHHTGHDETRHREQALDVRVDHRFPIIHRALILRLQSERQSGVVHKHINLPPFSRQFLDILRRLLAVSHIECQCQHVQTFSRQLLPDFIQTVFVSSRQNQSVAILSELTCTGESYPACSTCYQYNFVHIF